MISSTVHCLTRSGRPLCRLTGFAAFVFEPWTTEMPREAPFSAPSVPSSERDKQEAGQVQRNQPDQHVEAKDHVNAGRTPDDEDEQNGGTSAEAGHARESSTRSSQLRSLRE